MWSIPCLAVIIRARELRQGSDMKRAATHPLSASSLSAGARSCAGPALLLLCLSACATPAAPAPDLGQGDRDLAMEDDPGDLRLPKVSGPARLSETGLYADLPSRTLADGVLRYAPRYPL